MRLASLLGPDVKQLLKEDPEQLLPLLDEIHAEDLADIVSELDPDEAAALLERLPAEEAAPIFERLEDHEQEELSTRMPPESMAQIASEMAPDERADFFSVLPEAMGDKLMETLDRVDPEAAQDVRDIEKWPSTSAGHLMTTSYVSVSPYTNVQAALDAVRDYARENDSPVYNIYAMSEDERLVGIASLRQLILSTPYTPLSEVLRTNIISVPPDMDQEEVARRLAKYDLNEMPVIDDTGVLLGIITVDDIIDVLTQEQTEDVQKIGGVEPLDVGYLQTTFVDLVRKRGVWLVALFIGGFFTQTALRHYDPVFKAVEGASYYVPLLISAGGNSGSQSSTLVIRGLAVSEIKPRDWWRVLIREVLMGVVLGLGLGVIGFTRVFVSGEPFGFALSVGLTLVGIVMTGCTVGSMMPLALKRIGLDPATSSTPFIASLVDVAGIVVFVNVAKLIMSEVIALHLAPH